MSRSPPCRRLSEARTYSVAIPQNYSREIEVIAPELIEIGHPMGVYNAIDPHPYFGAIVTRCGVEYLENIQKQTRDE